MYPPSEKRNLQSFTANNPHLAVQDLPWPATLLTILMHSWHSMEEEGVQTSNTVVPRYQNKVSERNMHIHLSVGDLAISEVGRLAGKRENTVSIHSWRSYCLVCNQALL